MDTSKYDPGDRIRWCRSAAKRTGVTLEEWLRRRRSGLLWCSMCKSWKKAEEFGIDRAKRHGKAGECKRCKRVQHLAMRYRISRKQAFEYYANEHAPCEICERDDIKTIIDHCHKTGRLRGRLCHQCNLGLGAFRDSQELFSKASQYLKKHDRNPSEPMRVKNKGKFVVSKVKRNGQCIVHGCLISASKRGGRGMCSKHYQRFWKWRRKLKNAELV